jgi:succinyl-CoA synthetase beta subunit
LNIHEHQANFLDAGGSATRESIAQALEIILGEKRVSAVLINIFAGILRCDIIAEGVAAAARSMGTRVPIAGGNRAGSGAASEVFAWTKNLNPEKFCRKTLSA